MKKNTDNTARIRRVIKIALLSSAGACALANAAGTEDDFVLWPNMGYFRAYPLEKTGRQFVAYATAEVGVDDNLFRLSDAPGVAVFNSGDRGDTFGKLGVGAHASYDVSLQQFNLDAEIDRHIYDRFSILDKWTYFADASWLWRVGERLHGDLGYSRSQDLPDFAELQRLSADVILNQEAHASIAIRILSRVEARGLAEEQRYEHDDATLSALDNRVRAGTVGLVYVSPTETTFGVQYKESRGNYPTPEIVGSAVIDNDYRETEASAVFDKKFEEAGGFDARVGRTERMHEQLPQRDFEGITGRAHLRYAFRPKITIDLAAYRELRPIEEILTSFAVVRGFTVGPAWAPTYKTVFQASYIVERRKFGGDPRAVLVNIPPREDRTRGTRVAAGYKPSSHLEFGLAFERGIRDSNIALTDYEYNLFTLHFVASL